MESVVGQGWEANGKTGGSTATNSEWTSNNKQLLEDTKSNSWENHERLMLMAWLVHRNKEDGDCAIMVQAVLTMSHLVNSKGMNRPLDGYHMHIEKLHSHQYF